MSKMLSDKHRAELHASGLSDETIQACGFYSEDNPERLSAILGKTYAKSRGPALVIPFRNFEGEVNGFSRVKPDFPRKNRNDKPIKYESPKGSDNRVFFPPGVVEFLDDSRSELLITEGEKKAAKATQEGFPCLGLTGVYGWKLGKGVDRLIPDLEVIKWQGRSVVIAYDSDLNDKPEIREAESRLAQQLISRGAKVRLARLPDLPSGDRCGLDDFLVHFDHVALRKILNKATEPEPVKASSDKLPAHQIDSMPEARRFLEQYATHREGKTSHLSLRYQHEQFHAWNDLCYVPLEDSEIKGRVWRYLDTFASHITSTTVNNLVAAVKALTLVPSQKPMPSWLDTKGEFPPEELLATKSGLLHLPSLVENKPSLLPLTPRFFSPNALDYDFDPAAECPTWLEFLDSVWSSDPQSIETLQMMMGYLLLPDTRHHKLFMLLGPKRSGKGTIGRVIKALVGAGNIASPTLASLAGPFGKWPLLGRTVAIIADARLSGRTDAIAVMETLLSISGEDPQDIHRKCMSTITGVRLPVRFVILSNELPNMRDSSGAFTSRVIMLRMTQSFYGREDKRLTEKLLSEISGILNWSIMGWQMLHACGGFDQPESAKQLLRDLEDLASPVAQFIEDSCELGSECEAKASELFAGWKGWCKDHGRDHIGTRETFGKDLRAALPSLDTSRPRGTDGRREIVYQGIRLRIDATRIFE